jgi:predicted esterase
MRSPAHVRAAATEAAPKAASIEFREYPGGHGLSAQEITELVAWWLDR